MGTSPSSAVVEARETSQDAIVQLVLPGYYNDKAITNVEFEMASTSWQLILTNMAPGFTAARKDPTFTHLTSISYFYHTFYERLFSVNPMAQELFRDVNMQGKFLVKMLTLSLSEKSDPAKYEATLVMLAEVHNRRGVKAAEYGIVGDVLFYTLRTCIGDDIYNSEMHTAWVKIYSRMLRTMVPLAVAYELQHGGSQNERTTTYFATHVLSSSTTNSSGSV